MKKIKRNEYFKLVSETGKIPKDDEYDILPLDLDVYPLNDTTKSIADKNFMEESVNRNGEYMLRGHWLSDLSYQFAAKCGFTLKTVNSYNSYAYSDEQLAVFTYCEGDITLTPFTNREKYEKEKAETIRFYEEVYG